MTHIAFVTRHYGEPGRVSGVISYLRELTEALADRGVTVSIIQIKPGITPESSSNFYVFSQWNLIAFRRLISRIDPDLIVFVSSTSVPGLLMWWWVVLSFSIAGYRNIFYQMTNFYRTPGRLVSMAASKVFDQILAANSALLGELDIGVPVSILRPAVNLERIHRSVTEQPKAKQVVGFMGHYSSIKGADRFIELSRRPRLGQFSFAMAGGAKTRAEQLIFQRAEDRSRMQSNLNAIGYTASPLEVLSSFDVLVLPYRTGAAVLAVAQTAIEAMAFGIPVISTRNSAVEDLIIDQYNGFYCSSDEQFEQAIVSILSDEALYQKMSRNAKQTVTERFSIESRSAELLEIADV